MIDVESAWRGLEKIIRPLMDDFDIRGNKALEFGVDYGYSTAVLANFFKEVIGVDAFEGDIHAGERKVVLEMDPFQQAQKNLAGFDNIRLIKADYKDFIKTDNSRYDLIHVDIVHTYDATFECGLWSARHASMTIFHDTESYSDVKRAVEDIARETKKKAYNFPDHFGLGIIV